MGVGVGGCGWVYVWVGVVLTVTTHSVCVRKVCCDVVVFQNSVVVFVFSEGIQ